MSHPSPNIPRLRDFVRDLAETVAAFPQEAEVLPRAEALLRDLIAHDDWLPAAYAQPDPLRYRQYLLHCDSRERFSVVSFVWAAGQATPVHDHTVWGLVGMLRGAELSQAYELSPGGLRPAGPARRLEEGEVERVSPTIGDIHRVANAFDDRASISIHVYGANIGAVERATYAPDGTRKPFVSRYSNTTVPNLWDATAKADA